MRNRRFSFGLAFTGSQDAKAGLLLVRSAVSEGYGIRL